MSTNSLLEKSQDAWNRRDPDSYAALFSQDAVLQDPFSPDPLHGRQAVRANAAVLTTAFPDLEFEFLTRLVEGDTFAVEVVLTGTHTGPLMTPNGDVPATGRRMELRGCAIGRLDASGLVAEERRYFDPAVVLRQLGLLPDA